MTIIPLPEGRFTIDKTKRFVPFDESTDRLQERPVGSLLVEIQPFVLITSRDVLLLDTGLGFPLRDPAGKETGRLQLHHNLAQAGILPGDVTKVLLTHLHKDHAGGAVMKGEDGKDCLSFPNARYFIRRQEMDYAFEKGAPSYAPEPLECLRHHPNVEWLDSDTLIDGYIRCTFSQGHAPWHQVFMIQDEDGTVFFGGDEAPQLQQMKHRFVAKYDYDGKKAMEWRRQWWERGQAEHWTFLFYHDIKHAVWPVRG